MQNLKITSNSTGEPKFYHYCYVCNTQLNSCKQALLHCSGKRHRKKLQFLQSRKHPVGQIPSGPTIGAPPPPVNHGPGAAGSVDQSCFPLFPHTPGLQALPSAPAPFPSIHETPGQLVAPAPVTPPAACPTFYPQPAGVLTDQWAMNPMVPIFPNGPMNQHGVVQPQPNLVQFPPPVYHQQYPQLMGPQIGGSSSSSPLLLTDVSGSSYSGGPRSAVISPSDTSSLSSDLSANGRSFKCYVCQRFFGTLAQLHCHLQTARHYKHDQQQVYCRPNPVQMAPERKRESSETDSTTSPSIYYCSACNIAVNSKAEMDYHNAGHKQKQRSVGHQRKHSRSSSTSSEPPIEIIADSGYASGSGDDVIRVFNNSNSDKPTAKYCCQLCNIFLNSYAQAQQHLNSQKHQIRVNGRPPFRRKASNSFRKKQQNGPIASSALDSSQDTSHENCCSYSDDLYEKHSHSDGCETPLSPSPEPGPGLNEERAETDSTLTVRPTNSL